MQFKSRDVAHEDSTMKIDYNTRFLLAVRRKRKIIGYFIGHSEATAQDGFHLSKHHATFASEKWWLQKTVIQKKTKEHTVTASYGSIICSNRHQCKARFHGVCRHKQW